MVFLFCLININNFFLAGILFGFNEGIVCGLTTKNRILSDQGYLTLLDQ
jgi:hypothetical protein